MVIPLLASQELTPMLVKLPNSFATIVSCKAAMKYTIKQTTNFLSKE